MPSRLDSLAADDFAKGMPEVMQTIIRRVGGSAEQTESVEAVVELDNEAPPVTGTNGEYTETGGRIEVAASQKTTQHDHWVIDGEVYHQIGEAGGKDGATQTIVITRRRGHVGRETRVRR